MKVSVKYRLIFSVIALLITVSACGQKGDLYRPATRQQAAAVAIPHAG
jgi:predicted small lipoprotein YifL